MAFDQIATRKNARLRLAVTGPAGSGKTFSALLLAKEFGSKIGVLDSERGSAAKYAGEPGIPTFFEEVLEEKNVQEYISKIREAAEAGIDVLVIDSYSHSWIGALEAVDKMGGSKFSNGWKAVSPLVTKLVDAILSYPGHVIATMRVKPDFVVETVNGKATPKKIGLATVARDGTDYEFDVMLDLNLEGGVAVSKTRCSALSGGFYSREDIPKIAKTLKAWLSSGSALSPRDQFTERIRFAADAEALKAIAVDLKAQLSAGGLTEEDRAALTATYMKRKAEIEGAFSPVTEQPAS
jgi:translation initiation factor 1 (eIF-1/SUI1)